MINKFKEYIENNKNTKPFSINLPKELSKNVEEYKSKTPEEQKEWEDNAIKDMKEQGFYKNSPILNDMSDEQLRNLIKMAYNILNTGEDADD